MEDVESERRISRRKRKLSTRQGVVIGVATVAGLGLMTKLVSFLRREKPKKLKDGDIETLEAVLSGDAAKGALSPQTAEVHMFVNLENEEPDHGLVNGHEASPPRSKDADSVSEVTKKDDVTEDSEMHLSKDLAGDTNTLTTEESEPSPVSQEEVNVKEMPHSNGEEVEVKERNEDAVEPHVGDDGKHLVEDAVELHIEDEGKVDSEDAVTEQIHIEEKGERHIEDAEQIPSEDVVELRSGNEVKPHIEHAVELHTEDEGKQLNGDALEVPVEDAKKLNTEDEEKHHSGDAVEPNVVGRHYSEDAVEPNVVEDEAKHHNEDAGELQTENEAKPHTEEGGKTQSEDALEQLIDDAEKLETKDEEKQSSEEAVELFPVKDEEKRQKEDAGELQTQGEGKLHS